MAPHGDVLVSAAQQWQSDLAAWAIPEAILEQAQQSPWIHPVEMFTVTDEVPDSPSHGRARDGLTGSQREILDVGCGGGRATMALANEVSLATGVDSSAQMLQAYASAAQARGLPVQTIEGVWPEIADVTPQADVVVCHHVVYNVAQIVPFLTALNDHARRRVVLELPTRHPLSSMNPLWEQFWGLRRPTRPTAAHLVTIAEAMGLAPHLEVWQDEQWGARVALPDAERVRYARIRLCLTEDRDAEIAAALLQQQDAQPREVATVWWDRA
jgi:SAM-dependent methyltransferase